VQVSVLISWSSCSQIEFCIGRSRSWQLSLVREKEIRGRRRWDWMTRSPKMTGTRPRRNCGREPDIATASDTSPETVSPVVSVTLSAVCLPIYLPVNTRYIQLIRSQRRVCVMTRKSSLSCHPLFPCAHLYVESPSFISLLFSLLLFSITNAIGLNI